MERVTISLDQDLLAQFDGYLYANPSKAIRDLVRERLEVGRLSKDERAHVVGCLSYVVPSPFSATSLVGPARQPRSRAVDAPRSCG